MYDDLFYLFPNPEPTAMMEHAVVGLHALLERIPTKISAAIPPATFLHLSQHAPFGAWAQHHVMREKDIPQEIHSTVPRLHAHFLRM